MQGFENAPNFHQKIRETLVKIYQRKSEDKHGQIAYTGTGPDVRKCLFSDYNQKNKRNELFDNSDGKCKTILVLIM